MNSMRRRISIRATLEHIPMAALLPLASPVDGAGAGMTTSGAVFVELLSEVDVVGVAPGGELKDVMLDGKFSMVNVLNPSADGPAIVLRRPGGAGRSLSGLVLAS